jgi:hypothetical protein
MKRKEIYIRFSHKIGNKLLFFLFFVFFNHSGFVSEVSAITLSAHTSSSVGDGEASRLLRAIMKWNKFPRQNSALSFCSRMRQASHPRPMPPGKIVSDKRL